LGNFWRLKEASLVVCCDMATKIQYFGVREVLQKHLLLCSGLLKNISTVTNMHTAIEELLKVVFSNLSVTKLHKESQQDLK
jgi:hypothetical protein